MRRSRQALSTIERRTFLKLVGGAAGGAVALGSGGTGRYHKVIRHFHRWPLLVVRLAHSDGDLQILRGGLQGRLSALARPCVASH